jgi:hypothetical protein
VACGAVLVFLGRVSPRSRHQQCGNPLMVFQPTQGSRRYLTVKLARRSAPADR